MKTNTYLIVSFLVFLCVGCTANKFLPEGNLYYGGSEVNYVDDRIKGRKWTLDQEIKSIVERKENSKLLGSRPGVWFYHIAGEPKGNKGFKHWLKYKIGKQPVYIKDIQSDPIASQVKGFLINKGFFEADVQAEINKKKNSATIDYNITAGRVSTIRKVVYPEGDSLYIPIIEAIKEKSLISPGMRYDLATLQREQKRIEKYVEDQGFYFFDRRYLIYEADTTIGNKQIDLTLQLTKETPKQAKKRYRFNSIIIHPDYSINNDVKEATFHLNDTTLSEKRSKEMYMRRDILDDLIIMEKDAIYSKTAEEYTIEHLVDVGTYKFINVKFNQADSASLDSHVYLTPYTKKAIRFDLQAVSKSNNFVGPALSVSFLNRNTFRGGELLETSVNAAYEVQVNGQNNPALSALEIGFKSELTIPRLITPLNIDYYNRRFFPDTKIKLGVRIQERISVFRLTSFETAYGFSWKESVTKQHKLFPMSISYVRLSNESDELKDRLRLDESLSRSLDDQFIIGATYDFTLNTKAKRNSDANRHNFYFNGQVDVSGNMLSLIQRGLNSTENEEGKFKFLGLNYAQYFKASTDLRYYLNLGGSQELASRVILGAGWAYGNSERLPFVKQFASGGSNSIRAFRSRSVGPGAFRDDEGKTTRSNFFDQTGDIKLEGNLEYRFPIYGVVKGGVFLDAGNIWLMNASEEKQEGHFRTDQFLGQIAVGSGIGFRFDFSFFLLRFDLAFPLRDPSLDKDNRWVIDDIDPSIKSWRRDNLILNIAIGHAF